MCAASQGGTARPVEQAQTLEDAAAQLAAKGQLAQARDALSQATDIYAGLGAYWCLRRAETRLRPYGIRRGVRGPRRRATTGWQALSRTELTVAADEARDTRHAGKRRTWWAH